MSAHKADMAIRLSDVCFRGKSGHCGQALTRDEEQRIGDAIFLTKRQSPPLTADPFPLFIGLDGL